MRKVAIGCIVIALVSLVVGIVSRLSVTPVYGLESRAFAGFTAVMLLLAIALTLIEKK